MNNCKYLIIIFISLSIISTNIYAESYEPMIIGVPEFKPYTYQNNGKIIGSAITQSTPIFTTLNVKIKFKHYENYSLLLKALKSNTIQGFLLASQNPERDRYAEFSKPLAFNNWSWFSLKNNKFNYNSDKFKNSATVATIGKTNTFRWLTRNGYQVHSSSATQLPLLLLNKTIEAVFSAESVFLQACNDSEVNTRSFKRKVASKRPFGMYISRRYLDKNKGFMNNLNKLISRKPK